MTSNFGIKTNAPPYRQNLELDFPAGKSLDRFSSSAISDEWRKTRFNCRSFIIGRAYDEPCGSVTVENILMQRDYIID